MSEKQILRALATLSGPKSRAMVLAEPHADVEQRRLKIERHLDQLRQDYERGSRLAIEGSVAELFGVACSTVHRAIGRERDRARTRADDETVMTAT
jgi:hypothetical protein